MYNRFVSSLMAPMFIVEFRNDKLFKVLLYVVFFALLLSTRMIIQTTTYSGVSYSLGNEITTKLHENASECTISDYTLTCDNNQVYDIYIDGPFAVYFDSRDIFTTDGYLSPYTFVFYQDKMYVLYAGTKIKEEVIGDIFPSLDNVDFSSTSKDALIINAINDYILAYKWIWAPSLIIFDFLVNLMLFLIFDLFSAWMLRLRFPSVPFSQSFKMSVYSATALYLILIFNSLFAMNGFLLIILLLIAFRQNSQLTMEIMRRLKRKS